MNVRCSSCGTTYRVDPAKVPEDGVRARCSRCPNVIGIRREPAGASTRLPPAVTAAVRPAPEIEVAPTEPLSVSRPGSIDQEETTPRAEESVEGDQAATVDTAAAAPSATTEPAPDPESHLVDIPRDRGDASMSATTRAPTAFGSTDPHERARRLARALVSDIVAYHGGRRDRSLQEGSLRQELGDEIRKSWEEYTHQVGNQFARETSYFRDALNDILAPGAGLF